MRARATVLSLVASGALIASVHSQLIVPLASNDQHQIAPQAETRYRNQQPMAGTPGIQLPAESDDTPGTAPGNDAVILSDVIGTLKNINIFAGFTRDISSVSQRLESSARNATVLAPLNSAIQSLPWKPWEDPREYDQLGTNAYEGSRGEDRASANLQRFAESHIIPANPWKEGVKVKTMAGNTVWWEKKDGQAYVQPGNVPVDRVAQKVANGELWILKGVVNYAETA